MSKGFNYHYAARLHPVAGRINPDPGAKLSGLCCFANLNPAFPGELLEFTEICGTVAPVSLGMKTALYPGSFDPIHNGHVDVIERAAHLCDRVIVAVATNAAKEGLYSIPERIALIEESVRHIGEGVVVDSFEGLLVDFAAKTGADAVIRGLRAVSDFEYEFQMALMNRQLSPDLETLFLMPSQEHIFLSSRMVKEIARLGGEIGPFVPEPVAKALAETLSHT